MGAGPVVYASQLTNKIEAIKDIVTEDQSAIVVSNKLPTDHTCLGESVR